MLAIGKVKWFVAAVQTFDPEAVANDHSRCIERIVTAAAVSLAVLVVASVAVLIGMT